MRVPKAPGWSAIFATAALLCFLRHEQGMLILCLFLLAGSLLFTVNVSAKLEVKTVRKDIKPAQDRTFKEREKLTPFELGFIEKSSCPDCAGDKLLAGPTAGLAQNVMCANPACGSRFNILGFFGVERISDAKPHAPRLEREDGYRS